MSTYTVFLQQLINGLTIGMIYALIALGYTMVYGVAQLINFAHGEVFMVGAYFGLLAYALLKVLGAQTNAFFLFLPGIFLFAMALTALLGVLIERFTYRPLRDAPRLAPLITAIGVSFVLQNAVMLIAGPADKSFPAIVDVKQIFFSHVAFTNLQFVIMLVSLFLMVALHFFIKRTKMGKAMRAVADDREAASLMGINVNQ